MTPGARVAAAIDLLDAVIAAARDGGAAADVVAQRFFAARRYAGSKDRRAIRDLAWAAIRRFGERPESGRAALVAMADDDAALAGQFDGTAYGPEPVRADELRAGGGPVPAWLEPCFDRLIDRAEQAGLLDRAPLDLRVNPIRASVAEVAAALPGAATIAGLPQGLRLSPDARADLSSLLESGTVEVQDAASQHFIAACAPHAGGLALDLCAGAGGKALALGSVLTGAGEGAGRIVATDVARARLAELPPRATRAGLTIETRLLDPQREAAALEDLARRCDLVIVDAPCSGSGTWRRNPETRWRLTPARLARLVAEQDRLLALAASLVRPGGTLAYATCSLLQEEGMERAAAFLAGHEGWHDVTPDGGAGRGRAPGRLLTPVHDGCDGFFFALLQRP